MSDDDLRQKILLYLKSLVIADRRANNGTEYEDNFNGSADRLVSLIAAHHTTQTLALLDELREKAEVIPVPDGHGFGLATRVEVVPLAVLDDEIARLKGCVTE
jgi:hypothetical protein